MNESQKSVVNKLARNGWHVDLVDPVDDNDTVYSLGDTTNDEWDGDHNGTVYLSRRDRKLRSMTHYVEVDRDGTLHGQL